MNTNTNNIISEIKKTDNISFTEIFKLEEIQKMQDIFAEANEVASIITYPDGNPITKPSNFCSLCENIIRKTEKGIANCYKSDAILGVYNENGPTIQPCLSCGLLDAGVSIVVGNKHLANWLIGQVKDENQKDEKIIENADKIGIDRAIFKEALKGVTTMPYEKFEKVANMLYIFANQLSKQAYYNYYYYKLIKERDDSETFLIENEKKFRLIVEKTNDIFYKQNIKNGFFEYFSPNLTKVLGYQFEEIANLSFEEQSELIHPEDLPNLINFANELIEADQKNIQNTERIFRFKSKNNNYHWIHGKYSLVKDKYDKPESIIGSLQDITEKIKNEEAITLANQTYQNIFNSVSEAIYVLDINSTFIDVNKGAEKMYGYSREELIGQNPATVTAPGLNDLNLIITKTMTVYETGIPAHFEFWACRKNGEIFPKEVILNKGTYFGKEVIIATARDISENKKAKDLLIQSETKYKALVDNAFEGIIIVTLEGEILFGNQSIIKILEFNSIDEIIGRNVFEFLAEESIPKAINDFTNVAQGIDAYIAEYEGITSKGNKIWLESIGKLIDYNGKKVDIVSLRDITKLKLTTEESKRKELLIEAISEISQMLLTENKIDSAFEKLIKIIGEASGQDRTYIIEAFKSPENGNTIINQSFEWVKPGISREINNLDFQNFDISSYSSEILQLFENNIHVNFLTKDLPEEIRNNFTKQEIKSILLIPILIENQLWGLIGFDNCQTEYLWSSSDLDAFKSIGSIIGNYIKRKSDEETLINNEIKYRLLAENSSDVIWTMDKNGKYKYVSPSVLKMRGYTAEENMQQTFEEALSPESANYAKALFEETYYRLSKGENPEPVVLCMEQNCKNGATVWTEIAISAVFDDNQDFQHFLGITRNISDRKREEKIKSIQFNISKAVSEITEIKDFVEIIKRELKSLIDIKNFFIAFYNEDEKMLSNSICYDENESFDKWHVNDSLTGLIIKNNKAILLKKEDILSLYKNNEIKLYGQIAECWLGIPLIANGKPFGAFVVKSYDNPNAYSNSDMDILTYISQNISLALNKLKQDAEIRTALAKAKESDKLKSAFLANMSHEIRTPLNGILGFANLMLEEDFELEEVNQYAQIISKSGKRLMELINNIIDISRIESGTSIINYSVFSPEILIKDVVNQFLVQAENQKINLKFDLPENSENLLIKSDELKLHQILTNLINNALKFTSNGIIEISYKINNDNIRFQIKDSGIGIPIDEQSKIFNRFYQVNNSLSRGHEGAGLGLSLCKGLIELLEGKIWLHSEIGKGSVFSISLPLTKVEKEIINNKSESENLYFIKSHTILVAEDEITNFQYVETVLKKSGFKVLHAADGEEAINHVRTNNDIDLVLMDVKMPILDGYSATKEIRKFNNSIRIIALTAFALSGENEKAINAGCNDYIAKPVNKDSLLKIINKNITRI